MTNEKTMRQVFGETLAEIGAANDRLVVLDADVSSSTKTSIFGKAYPDRFFNVGIAEANMVSIAAGMATCGYIPVVSTFAFLMSLRAGDQVRSQIAHSNLNVKLAGGYSGLSDFADGSSHQSIADIAVMRALPNMTVIAPADMNETKEAVRCAVDHRGPVYLRLSRAEVGECVAPGRAFTIGTAWVARPGSSCTIFTTGTMLKQCLEAWAILQTEGVDAEVVHVPTIKPLDRPAIVRSVAKTGCAVTVEEHGITGGFGSAIAECIVQMQPCPIEFAGLVDTFGQSGTLVALYEKYGLTGAAIAGKAKKAVERKKL